MSQFLLPFLIAFLISIILTPLVRLFAAVFGWVAQPNQERWHKKNTPLLGGVAIFLAFLISFAIFAERNWVFWAFIVCAMGSFGVGLIDDLIHIQPYSKLIGQIVVASVLLNFGFKINTGPYLSAPFTVIWVVGVMNAFNLLDNMDGLCAGIAFIAASTTFAYSVLNFNNELALISVILAGSTLGFLRYNFNPAKIFMGDCGSLFLGFAFAMVALIGTQKEASGMIFTILVPASILAVPIFDTLLVTFTRRINSRPISRGGKDHSSHRLVALGLSEKRAVVLLYIIAAICGSGAILYDIANKPLVLILSSMLVIGLLLFGMFLGGVEIYSKENFNIKNIQKKRKKSNGMPVILNGFIYHKRRIVEVVIDFAIICIAYVSAYLLRFEGVISPQNQELILISLPIIISIKLLMFFAFGVYRGIWKYIGLHDAIATFKAVTASSIISMLALLFLFRFHGYSRSLFIIDWLILLLLVSGVRIALRLFREFFAVYSLKGKRVLIVGAGDAGELLLREIRHNKNLNYIPVGFLDDDMKKVGNYIHGVPVFGTTRHLAALCRRNRIEEILIAIPSVSDIELADILERCRRYKIKFKHISSIMLVK